MTLRQEPESSFSESRWVQFATRVLHWRCVIEIGRPAGHRILRLSDGAVEIPLGHRCRARFAAAIDTVRWAWAQVPLPGLGGNVDCRGDGFGAGPYGRVHLPEPAGLFPFNAVAQGMMSGGVVVSSAAMWQPFGGPTVSRRNFA